MSLMNSLGQELGSSLGGLLTTSVNTVMCLLLGYLVPVFSLYAAFLLYNFLGFFSGGIQSSYLLTSVMVLPGALYLAVTWMSERGASHFCQSFAPTQ